MSVIAGVKPDPRINAYRSDLAAAELKGLIEADRYVAGEPGRVTAPFATMRGQPDDRARTTTQLLFGEAVTIFETGKDWAWVQNRSDLYVGYVPASALARTVLPTTHTVGSLRTYSFPKPDLKTPPLCSFSFLSPVAVEEEENGWARLAGGGWVYAKHLRVQRNEADIAATGLRFVGVPYLWGGRTSLGLDCSALVQLSLNAAGLPCPRDSDMQRDSLGQPIDMAGPFRRNDLIFFPGHVGIMVDEAHMVHANAFHMMAVCEPLADVVARAGAIGAMTAARRLV